MGESRLTGARNSLWSVAPVVVFKQKCDGTGCVSQSIFLAAAWRKGPREPDEGWRIGNCNSPRERGRELG